MAHSQRRKSSRRQMQKEETRRMILAAAYALFEQKGYEKTTMRQLARQADVGLGTIFQHFPDKPSLLISAFSEDLDGVLHNALETVPAANIKMQLMYIAAELFHYIGSETLFARTLFRETIFLAGPQAGMLPDKVSLLRRKIAGLLQEAADRGELDRRTDIERTVTALLSFLLLGLVQGLREPEFNARKQTMLFASLLDSCLPVSTRP